MGTIARTSKAGGGSNFQSGQTIDPGEVNTDFNTAYTEINGNLDDGNIETATIPGAKSLRGTEISAPSAPSSNDVLLYAFDSSGVTHWRSHDSSGRTTLLGKQIVVGTSTTSDGALAALATAGNAATGANTTETNAISYDLPANALANTGDHIEIHWSVRTAGNANNKRLRVYFGATTIFDTGAVAYNNQVFYFLVRVYRITVSTQGAVGFWTRVTGINTEGAPSTLIGLTGPTETLSSAVTVKCTMLNGTANANDVQSDTATIRFVPAT